MLVGTMFHRLLKVGVPHVLLKTRIENTRQPQTCFFPWIFLLREFPCWQAPRLPPIKAIQTLNQFQIMSRQLQTPQPSFSLRKASLVCAFVSSSGWKHGFVWQSVRTVFERFFSKTDLKNKSTIHSQHALRVSCFY